MLSLNRIGFTFSFILEAEKGIKYGFSLSAVTVLFITVWGFLSAVTVWGFFVLLFFVFQKYLYCKAVGESYTLE